MTKFWRWARLDAAAAAAGGEPGAAVVAAPAAAATSIDEDDEDGDDLKPNREQKLILEKKTLRRRAQGAEKDLLAIRAEVEQLKKSNLDMSKELEGFKFGGKRDEALQRLLGDKTVVPDGKEISEADKAKFDLSVSLLKDPTTLDSDLKKVIAAHLKDREIQDPLAGGKRPANPSAGEEAADLGNPFKLLKLHRENPAAANNAIARAMQPTGGAAVTIRPIGPVGPGAK
jgi:hypothetical protein